MNARRKLIVTGLSGLIGSTLRRLAAPRFELANLDLTEGVDLTDAAQVEAFVARHTDAVAVVHLAAFTDVSAAHAQQGDRAGACYCLNVEGTRNVVRACTQHGLHLVHVSTDFVFDGARDAPYTEHDAPHPIEWYGETKLWAEEIVREASSWTIARIAFPFVAGAAPRADFVRKVAQRLAAGEAATLFDDQWITPTFGDDIARGLLWMTEGIARGEIIHLVGSESLTPFALGRMIAEAFGLDATQVRRGSLADYLKTDPRPRQRCLRLANAKWTALAAAHGLRMPTTLAAALGAVRESLMQAE